MKHYDYPSIYHIGHKLVQQIFDGDVVIEEKIDGSCFTMGRLDGELICHSKRTQLRSFGASEKLFARGLAVAEMLEPLLTPDWLYRGEYLRVPKHNALAYSRVPKNHIMIFDVARGHEDYLSPEEKAAEATRLGLECVPVLHRGPIDFTELQGLLNVESVLGGTKVEGVVVKNYQLWGPECKVLMAKLVSEAFKERNRSSTQGVGVGPRALGEWAKNNPGRQDFLQQLIATYRAPARWDKAIQHLREAGELEHAPRDIGKLIVEIKMDVERECREEIMEALYRWASPHLLRAVAAGFPEYYKQRLAAQQLENQE